MEMVSNFHSFSKNYQHNFYYYLDVEDRNVNGGFFIFKKSAGVGSPKLLIPLFVKFL